MADSWNQVWIGGVLLAEIPSGDVSFVDKETTKAKEKGGSWVVIPTAGVGSYRFWVDSATDVVIRYVS